MLYLIQSGNFYKIGHAANLKKRMTSYMVHNPEFVLLGVCNGDLNDERDWHVKLKDHLIKGEWFQAPQEVIDGLLKKFTLDNIEYKLGGYLLPIIEPNWCKADSHFKVNRVSLTNSVVKTEYEGTKKWKKICGGDSTEVSKCILPHIKLGKEYTFQQLEKIIIEHFYYDDSMSLPVNFIRDNFPEYLTRRKTIQGKKYTVYKFY